MIQPRPRLSMDSLACLLEISGVFAQCDGYRLTKLGWHRKQIQKHHMKNCLSISVQANCKITKLHTPVDQYLKSYLRFFKINFLVLLFDREQSFLDKKLMFEEFWIVWYISLLANSQYQQSNMNFFLKGDYKIPESWQKKPSARVNSRQKSRDKEGNNSSLVNAGKKIISEAKDMLDDEVTKHILREFAAEIPPPPSIKSEKKISSKDQNVMRLPPKQKGSLPQGENDLLTSMAARLKTVEMTLKNQRQELKDKNLTIEKLKSQNIFLKGFRQDAPRQYQKLKKLEEQNGELKKRVSDMQEYLKKYGLKWVGGKIQGNLDKAGIKKAIAKGNYQYRMPKQVDINTVIRRIEQLNGGLYSQGKGTQIYVENGIHKFRKADPLPIGFFANGIAIKGYKFMSYQTKESLQVLSDLLDGYFPYILKSKYPNGVFLKVVDKLAERYSDQISEENVVSFQSKADKDFKPPSKEEFLNKLPKSIMKNGKVIKIRDQIEKRLNGEVGNKIKEESDEQNEDLQKIDGVTVFKTTQNGRLQRKEVNEQQLCTLKIRNEKGDIFILHLTRQKKLVQVYQWMRKVVKGLFKIMSNFPRRAYSQNQPQTLQQLGFFPNAMLHIQPSQN